MDPGMCMVYLSYHYSVRTRMAMMGAEAQTQIDHGDHMIRIQGFRACVLAGVVVWARARIQGFRVIANHNYYHVD
jgi:hypothetical protein